MYQKTGIPYHFFPWSFHCCVLTFSVLCIFRNEREGRNVKKREWNERDL